MKAIITGFDPFDKEAVNPAWEAVRNLPHTIGNCQIIKLQIPTVFGKSIELLREWIGRENPDIVICVGQAGGRCGITPEYVAINLNDARIEDNEGNKPLANKIEQEGDDAYFTTLPARSIVNRLKENNIPAQLSYTAGTFVCNHIFYGLMHTVRKECPAIKGGFIHVPYLPEQTLEKNNQPFMSREMITKGLELAIVTTMETEEDDLDAGQGQLD